ncbi:MAG: orotidine-5'-phosphate decarboxylase [Candidatus Eisenbacteria bacterium]
MSSALLPSRPEERLIVALDFPSAGEAVAMAARLGPEGVWVKIGLELYVAEGPSIVQRVAATGRRIFLDLKFHDIPNTVAGAVRSAARLPVGLMNLHAAAGPAAMEAARDAAREAAAARGPLGLLAVTRLTSLVEGGSDFADVEAAAERAAEAGLFGVVCPAPAAPRLRARFGDRLALVCPGIRPAGSDRNDQAQVATPAGAIASGADWIVVGRPVTRAADPASAVREILEEIAEGQRRRKV